MVYTKKINSEKKAPTNHYDVIIVGCGPAGITSALTLIHSRKYKGNVLVLEASDAPGGRAQSLNLEIDGKLVTIDLGPAWFHRMKGETLTTTCEKTVKRAGYKEFIKDNESVIVFAGGHRFSKKLFYKIEREMGRIVYNCTDRTKSVWELLEPVVNKYTEKYKGRFGERTKDLLWKIAEAEYGGVDAGVRIDKLNNFDYSRIMDRTDGMLPTYGVGNIFKDFAKPLIERKLVKFNHYVKSILYDDKTGLVNIDTNQGNFTAKQVILTTPVSAIKKMQFDEVTMPQQHRDAVNGLEMGHLEKAFLFFDKGFFSRHNIEKVTHLHVYDDKESDPKFYLLVPQKNYAMMLIGGDKSKEFVALSEEEKLNYAISGINEAFKTSLRNENFKGRHHFTNWTENELFNGSYSVLRSDSPLIQNGELLFDPRAKLNEPICVIRNGKKQNLINIAGEANLTVEKHNYYEVQFPDEVELILSTHFCGAFASGRIAAQNVIKNHCNDISIDR